MKFSTYSIWALVLAICGSVGCGESVDPAEAVAAANSNNIQRVSNLYLAYQAEHDWVGPPDETKLKEFIRSLSTPQLTRIGVDPAKLDELFVSERDVQPFKIRYSVVGNMMGSSEPVVFESVGVDGKRMVGTLGMEQREVDNEEFELLIAGKAPIAKTPARDR